MVKLPVIAKGFDEQLATTAQTSTKTNPPKILELPSQIESDSKTAVTPLKEKVNNEKDVSLNRDTEVNPLIASKDKLWNFIFKYLDLIKWCKIFELLS